MQVAVFGMNQVWGVNHRSELDTVWLFTVFGLKRKTIPTKHNQTSYIFPVLLYPTFLGPNVPLILDESLFLVAI